MVYGTRKITEPATTTATSTAGITWPHNLTTLGEMSTSAGGGFGLGVGVGVGVAGGPTLAAAQQGQGVAALLVMLAVLCFIFAYCCWGAPFCRSLCRRYCCCRLEDPEPDPRFGNSDQAIVATPTIILLPHGRMLVVDGTIFTQFQSDTTGLDLVELGDSMIRAQRNPRTLNRHQLQNSQGSILEMDAETPSKDSLGSIGCFPPPTYESIYGKEEGDMPPSYSDILLHRFANLPHEIDMHDYCHDGKEEIEMQSLESCPHIVGNPMNALPYPYAAVTSFSSQSFPRRNISRNPSIISNPLDNYYMDNELDIYRFDSGMVQPQCVNVSNNGSGTWDDRRVANDNENENRRPTDNGNQSAQNEDLTLNNETRHVHIAQEANNAVDGNEIMNTRNRARSISRISQEDERTNCENLQRAIGESVVDFGISSYLAQTEISHEGAIDGSRNNSNRNENSDVCRVPRGYAEDRTSAGNSNSERNRNDGTATDGSYLSRHMRNSNASIVSDSSAHAGDSEGIYPDEDGGNFGALADIRESRV